MKLSNALYYGSAIPVAIGVFMAYKAGQIEQRKADESEVWKTAASDDRPGTE